MNLHVLQKMALVMTGNAALRGRDVDCFWPDADIFQFSKVCEFLERDGADWRAVASDPMAWFTMLRPWCKGLRLHLAPRAPRSTQMPLPEHVTAGFVGGGARWLIIAIGADRSQVWEGFDRVLDRDDPERKIWGNSYLLVAETVPQAFRNEPLAPVALELEAILADIEQLAREMQADNFATCFANARAALKGESKSSYHDSITEYSEVSAAGKRLLEALGEAWVFGGMGSWNDIGTSDEALNARYERLSADLYECIKSAILAIANESYG